MDTSKGIYLQIGSKTELSIINAARTRKDMLASEFGDILGIDPRSFLPLMLVHFQGYSVATLLEDPIEST